jgi:hypothetical protein
MIDNKRDASNRIIFLQAELIKKKDLVLLARQEGIELRDRIIVKLKSKNEKLERIKTSLVDDIYKKDEEIKKLKNKLKGGA